VILGVKRGKPAFGPRSAGHATDTPWSASLRNYCDRGSVRDSAWMLSASHWCCWGVSLGLGFWRQLALYRLSLIANLQTLPIFDASQSNQWRAGSVVSD
jgi:hypothetical protein